MLSRPKVQVGHLEALVRGLLRFGARIVSRDVQRMANCPVPVAADTTASTRDVARDTPWAAWVGGRCREIQEGLYGRWRHPILHILSAAEPYSRLVRNVLTHTHAAVTMSRCMCPPRQQTLAHGRETAACFLVWRAFGGHLRHELVDQADMLFELDRQAIGSGSCGLDAGQVIGEDKEDIADLQTGPRCEWGSDGAAQQVANASQMVQLSQALAGLLL